MPGVSLKRSGNTANGSRYSVQAISKAPIGSYESGDVIIIRARRSEALVNATTAPGLSVGAWEGPYVRVYPHVASGNRSTARMAARSSWKVGEFAQVEDLAGALLDVTIGTTAEDDFFYEFDAVGCPPIVLPFSASIELVTCRAGCYLFDVYATKATPQDVSTRREYRQTRVIAGNVANDILLVPMGAIDVGFTGSALTVQAIYDNVSGKIVGNGTAQQLLYDMTGNQVPGLRMPLSGAFALACSTPAANPPERGLMVTFYCNLG